MTPKLLAKLSEHLERQSVFLDVLEKNADLSLKDRIDITRSKMTSLQLAANEIAIKRNESVNERMPQFIPKVIEYSKDKTRTKTLIPTQKKPPKTIIGYGTQGEVYVSKNNEAHVVKKGSAPILHEFKIN
nr:hypothetical protein cemce18_00024 [uncultured bacterium]